jgi:hypothetical protein
MMFYGTVSNTPADRREGLLNQTLSVQAASQPAIDE